MKEEIKKLIAELQQDVEVLEKEIRAKSDKSAKLYLIIVELQKILKIED